MKPKFWKYAALVLALCLIFIIAAFANSMLGNPVSAFLARNSAEEHLQNQYPGSDYQIERIAFSFKDTCYHAFVESPSSVDTYFSVCIDMWGQVRYDTFDSVESRWNTYRRLEDEYRVLTDTVFDNPSIPYQSNVMFGTLEIHDRRAIEDSNVTSIPDYALIMDELVIDGAYDIRQLGRQAGHLIIYVDTDTLTFEQAARIMLDFKNRFDAAGIPFYAMDFTLQYPLPEEGPRPDESIRVEHFPYSELYEENLPQRLEQAHHALDAYYSE